MDETTLMLDSTTIKVHQHASGAKKGGDHEETGRSRGGLTTKVYAVTDGLGNPCTLFALQREPKRYLHGKDSVGVL